MAGIFGRLAYWGTGWLCKPGKALCLFDGTESARSQTKRKPNRAIDALVKASIEHRLAEDRSKASVFVASPTSAAQMMGVADLKHNKLSNGSRVAVIGGGPAGSFFSYFVIDMAERVGISLHVDIYEPRDFSVPGPRGCNMCGGVLHESLVQSLAAEGINLPTTVVQRGLDSNTLHMDVGSIRIETPQQEKRIATTFRGIGPCDLREPNGLGLDGYLMKLAVNKGANQIKSRIDKVEWLTDPENPDPQAKRMHIGTQGGTPQTYDLVVVTAGVNTSLLRQFQVLDVGYESPRTTKCFVGEYHLGEESVTQYLGTSMHAFLLNIPRLDFGALVPKGDYVTLILLGENVDENLVRAFVNDPAVKQCLPPDFTTDQFACSCAPRINVQGSAQPFSDRLVFIGDAGVTRLYKDGIGSAYRAAKVVAKTVIFEGVSEKDFRRHYLPFCQTMRRDNSIGKLIFAVVRQIQKIRLTRKAVFQMVAAEQRGKASAVGGMSMVLWDMFTGSASYHEILLRILRPVFWTRFLWNIADSLLTINRGENAKSRRMPLAHDLVAKVQPEEQSVVEQGALGKHYADGEIIIRQGEVGNSMFVIQEGQVEIVEELDGKTVRLGVRGAGQFFGEMSIFEREVRSATVRAQGTARVLTVDEKTLLRRIHEDPSLAYQMVRSMSHRIRELSGEVVRLHS